MPVEPFHVKSSRDAWLDALDGLASRFALDARQREQLALLLGALSEDAQAPTSVRDPAEAVDVHIADSLVALELEEVVSAERLADLGAGAGFPGLPLAIARPGAEVALVESQSRKCRFLIDVVALAGVENARVVCVRAENWREGAGVQDVVLARALAPQPVVLEYAAPLLKLEGTLVDWRGRRNEAEEASALRAAEELGLEGVRIVRVEPFKGARDHHLHLYRKVMSTPERFPRRPGMARKRPLGLSKGLTSNSLVSNFPPSGGQNTAIPGTD
jgi:16S rRNA (guanine527-N7)-methyltransferase